MSNNIHYHSCPVCGAHSFSQVLTVKDFTVSKETFAIHECAACTLRFTQDVLDQNEIGRYYRSADYISHTNTSKGIINSLYQLVRKRTMTGKRKLVQKFTGRKKGQMLDVGSGIGTFAHEMKTAGWKVTGLEPDEGARTVAEQQYGMQLQDMEAFYQLGANSFDAITLWHVLEHVHDLHPYVQQLKKVLKEEGRIFIAVPNYTSDDAAIYKEFWAAYDVPRHLYHFSPRAMKELMTKNGLKVQAYKPMWYDSFYISLLSSKYKSGRPHLVPSFWNGLRSNFSAWSDARKCSSVIYVVSK